MFLRTFIDNILEEEGIIVIGTLDNLFHYYENEVQYLDDNSYNYVINKELKYLIVKRVSGDCDYYFKYDVINNILNVNKCDLVINNNKDWIREFIMYNDIKYRIFNKLVNNNVINYIIVDKKILCVLKINGVWYISSTVSAPN